MKKSSITLIATCALIALPAVAHAAGLYVGFSHTFTNGSDTNYHTANQIKSSTGVQADVIINTTTSANVLAAVTFCDATRNTCGTTTNYISPGSSLSISTSINGAAVSAGELVNLNVQAIPNPFTALTYPVSLSGSWRSN